MGGQSKEAGRDIIDTRLASQGNQMSIFRWSSCIVLIGFLLMWGLTVSTEQVVVTEKKAEVVLADVKKQEEKPAETKTEAPKPQPEPAAEVIDTQAQNTQVQQVVVSDCEQMQLELQKYDWDVALMTAIAKAESSCRANAVGDKSLTYFVNGREYGYSVGFFQIRILEGREHCDTFDIAANVACAYSIYKGQGLRAWSVYTNGMYAKYL